MFGNMKKDIKARLVNIHNICKEKNNPMRPAMFNLASAMLQYNPAASDNMIYDIIANYHNSEYIIPGEFESFIRELQAA